MPFDVAGNFTRSYNFQQDRDNGIKILAARVDGEFDNFATGMNAVFFRDGRVPMQADLRMNINRITGLADGAVGSPALKFNTDASTGPYLDGLNRYAISVNGVQRSVSTTTGMDVTGVLSQGGAPVATQAFVAGAYLPLSGGTLSGALTATSFTATGVNAAFFPAPRDGTTGTPVLYAPTANTFKVFTNGADRFAVSDTAVTVNPVSTFNSRMLINGNGAATSVLTLSDTGNTSGANLLFNGNGGVTPSKTIRVIGGNMEWVNSAYSATIMSLFDNGNLAINGSMFTVNGAKWQAQHDGSDAYVRSNTGNMFLGAGGNNIIQVAPSGPITVLSSGGFIQNQGNGGSYSVGFSSQHTGRVGYHMYNGGGVTEWVTYQPAGGTGHEYRIAKGASGSLTDAWYLNTAGDMYALGHISVGNEIWVGGNSAGSNTGVIRFGSAGAASSKYLFYDGSIFNLSASLSVGGNITSTSDARLKTNVRDFGDGMAIVRAMRPKRFDMYGKSDFGFVAQELQQVLPEAVTTGKGGYLSVDYGRLTAPLAAAIQSLNDRLDRAGL